MSGLRFRTKYGIVTSFLAKIGLAGLRPSLNSQRRSGKLTAPLQMTGGRLSFWIEPPDPRGNLRLLRAIFWLATACAGFLQAWAARFWISPDGNNYLDVASAYLRADWAHAVNAYWSPIFS